MEKLEEEIIYYTFSYIYKYIKHIGKKDDELIEISKWNTERKEKEFDKFNEWIIKKYKLDNVFTNYIDSYIYSKLLIQFNKKTAYNYVKQLNVKDITISFYYKCLRRIAKFYYEEDDKESVKDNIYKIIKKTLTNILSLNNIINLLYIHNNDSDNSSLVSYTYSNSDILPSIDNSYSMVDNVTYDLSIDLPYIEQVELDERDAMVDNVAYEQNIKKIKIKQK